MPGSYSAHLDEFGICTNRDHEGIEMMSLESKDERTGRWKTENVPACAVCYGLK